MATYNNSPPVIYVPKDSRIPWWQMIWDTIYETTCSDPVLSVLCNRIQEGFPPDSNSLEPSLHQFGNIKCIVNIPEGDVIMFCDRVVLPSSLRSKALRILHSAHQRTSAMDACAKSLCSGQASTRIQKRKEMNVTFVVKTLLLNQPSLPRVTLIYPVHLSNLFLQIFLMHQTVITWLLETIVWLGWSLFIQAWFFQIWFWRAGFPSFSICHIRCPWNYFKWWVLNLQHLILQGSYSFLQILFHDFSRIFWTIFPDF